MSTPIFDFVSAYAERGGVRLHMPGHKGKGPLGVESLDITEIKGADSLYEADGIILESEKTAARLFGSRRTLFSTEGSSHCVRAMLYLALVNRRAGSTPAVLAARNVHRSFISAAALLDLSVEWLLPEENGPLCACPVTPKALERALGAMAEPPCAVYITSPDYLGNIQDIAALAETAHKSGVPLIVDNAHGAYLRFLEKPAHPLELEADLCCDSAHKTLPVLTGGAMLHVGKNAPEGIDGGAERALALFGSTSPSYLTLMSLELCADWLSGGGAEEIRLAARRLDELKKKLSDVGWALAGQEPLKLTIDAPASGWDGREAAEYLRGWGIECEHADRDSLVLMASHATAPAELERVFTALKGKAAPALARGGAPVALGERAMSIRSAMFSPRETVPTKKALGRVCAGADAACPPAVPVVLPGERIGEKALRALLYYGVSSVEVVRR